jgi:hypothetical protein
MKKDKELGLVLALGGLGKPKKKDKGGFPKSGFGKSDYEGEDDEDLDDEDEDDGDEEEEESSSDKYTALMEEMHEARESGDAEAEAKALKTFVKLCMR